MVEIECLVCGKAIKIPQYIDTERYDGQVPCQECGALLHIKLVKSKVRKYRKLIDKKPTEIKVISAVPNYDEAKRLKES